MSDVDLIFADLLAERVAQVERQEAELVAAIEGVRLARSLTFADDEHDPEGSTASLDQARDQALLDQTRHTLAELLAAQHRLVTGRYGRCEQCGRPIPVERLRARPEATRCVTCSAQRSRRSSAR